MVWWAHCARTTPTIRIGTLKQLDSLGKPPTGLEPVTSPLPRVCSTTELRWRSRLLSGRARLKTAPEGGQRMVQNSPHEASPAGPSTVRKNGAGGLGGGR